jgi:GntR family transcriptional regulator / MocR family aminotransferase
MADGGFTRHLRKMNRVYRERRDIVCETVEKSFGDHLDLIPGNAGLHVAALAKKASVEAIASIARQAAGAGIAFQQLASYAVGTQTRAGITIAYGRIPTARIAEGLQRLRKYFS